MKISLLQDMRALMDEIIMVRYTDLARELVCCRRLLEMGDRENHLYAVTFAYTYLGDYYIAQNDTGNCGLYLRKAELLSEENGYGDLLLRVYNLFAICYEALSDEHTAMQYYLKALQLAREHHDPSIESIIMNNIGNNFDVLGDYPEAWKYYLQACTLLENCPSDLPNLSYIRLRLWSNMAEICRSLGQIQESHQYLTWCESLDDQLKDVKVLTLCRGWCGYFAATQEPDRAEHYANTLLSCVVGNTYEDKYLAYEMLISCCQIMIRLDRPSSAQKLLDHILKLPVEGETDRIQQIQKLNTLFCETFGTQEERSQAYFQYYRVMDQAEDSIRQAKANGLKNILYLDELKNSLVVEKRDLTEEAHLDELTKLYNRRYFNKLVSKTIADPDTKRLGFIMLDVDYFKEYNDTNGHGKGDIALQSVAYAISKEAPPSVMASRYGGDEFACICVNMSDEEMENYIRGVQGLLKGLAIEHSASLCGDVLTLSIGYSSRVWSEEQIAESLAEEADQALYRSKNAGRNTYTAWKGPDENHH